MILDLTDEEKLALAVELKRAITQYRYPLSPRVQTLKAILAKGRAAVRRHRRAPSHVKAGRSASCSRGRHEATAAGVRVPPGPPAKLGSTAEAAL
jgi:hypothetical protein